MSIRPLVPDWDQNDVYEINGPFAIADPQPYSRNRDAGFPIDIPLDHKYFGKDQNLAQELHLALRSKNDLNDDVTLQNATTAELKEINDWFIPINGQEDNLAGLGGNWDHVTWNSMVVAAFTKQIQLGENLEKVVRVHPPIEVYRLCEPGGNEKVGLMGSMEYKSIYEKFDTRDTIWTPIVPGSYKWKSDEAATKASSLKNSDMKDGSENIDGGGTEKSSTDLPDKSSAEGGDRRETIPESEIVITPPKTKKEIPEWRKKKPAPRGTKRVPHALENLYGAEDFLPQDEDGRWVPEGGLPNRKFADLIRKDEDDPLYYVLLTAAMNMDNEKAAGTYVSSDESSDEETGKESARKDGRSKDDSVTKKGDKGNSEEPDGEDDKPAEPSLDGTVDPPPKKKKLLNKKRKDSEDKAYVDGPGSEETEDEPSKPARKKPKKGALGDTTAIRNLPSQFSYLENKRFGQNNQAKPSNGKSSLRADALISRTNFSRKIAHPTDSYRDRQRKICQGRTSFERAKWPSVQKHLIYKRWHLVPVACKVDHEFRWWLMVIDMQVQLRGSGASSRKLWIFDPCQSVPKKDGEETGDDFYDDDFRLYLQHLANATLSRLNHHVTPVEYPRSSDVKGLSRLNHHDMDANKYDHPGVFRTFETEVILGSRYIYNMRNPQTGVDVIHAMGRVLLMIEKEDARVSAMWRMMESNHLSCLGEQYPPVGGGDNVNVQRNTDLLSGNDRDSRQNRTRTETLLEVKRYFEKETVKGFPFRADLGDNPMLPEVVYQILGRLYTNHNNEWAQVIKHLKGGYPGVVVGVGKNGTKVCKISSGGTCEDCNVLIQPMTLGTRVILHGRKRAHPFDHPQTKFWTEDADGKEQFKNFDVGYWSQEGNLGAGFRRFEALANNMNKVNGSMPYDEGPKNPTDILENNYPQSMISLVLDKEGRGFIHAGNRPYSIWKVNGVLVTQSEVISKFSNVTLLFANGRHWLWFRRYNTGLSDAENQATTVKGDSVIPKPSLIPRKDGSKARRRDGQTNTTVFQRTSKNFNSYLGDEYKDKIYRMGDETPHFHHHHKGGPATNSWEIEMFKSLPGEIFLCSNPDCMRYVDVGKRKAELYKFTFQVPCFDGSHVKDRPELDLYSSVNCSDYKSKVCVKNDDSNTTIHIPGIRGHMFLDNGITVFHPEMIISSTEGSINSKGVQDNSVNSSPMWDISTTPIPPLSFSRIAFTPIGRFESVTHAKDWLRKNYNYEPLLFSESETAGIAYDLTTYEQLNYYRLLYWNRLPAAYQRWYWTNDCDIQTRLDRYNVPGWLESTFTLRRRHPQTKDASAELGRKDTTGSFKKVIFGTGNPFAWDLFHGNMGAGTLPDPAGVIPRLSDERIKTAFGWNDASNYFSNTDAGQAKERAPENVIPSGSKQPRRSSSAASTSDLVSASLKRTSSATKATTPGKRVRIADPNHSLLGVVTPGIIDTAPNKKLSLDPKPTTAAATNPTPKAKAFEKILSTSTGPSFKLPPSVSTKRGSTEPEKRGFPYSIPSPTPKSLDRRIARAKSRAETLANFTSRLPTSARDKAVPPKAPLSSTKTISPLPAFEPHISERDKKMIQDFGNQVVRCRVSKSKVPDATIRLLVDHFNIIKDKLNWNQRMWYKTQEGILAGTITEKAGGEAERGLEVPGTDDEREEGNDTSTPLPKDPLSKSEKGPRALRGAWLDSIIRRKKRARSDVLATAGALVENFGILSDEESATEQQNTFTDSRAPSPVNTKTGPKSIKASELLEISKKKPSSGAIPPALAAHIGRDHKKVELRQGYYSIPGSNFVIGPKDRLLPQSFYTNVANGVIKEECIQVTKPGENPFLITVKQTFIPAAKKYPVFTNANNHKQYRSEQAGEIASEYPKSFENEDPTITLDTAQIDFEVTINHEPDNNYENGGKAAEGYLEETIVPEHRNESSKIGCEDIVFESAKHPKDMPPHLATIGDPNFITAIGPKQPLDIVTPTRTKSPLKARTPAKTIKAQKTQTQTRPITDMATIYLGKEGTDDIVGGNASVEPSFSATAPKEPKRQAEIEKRSRTKSPKKSLNTPKQELIGHVEKATIATKAAPSKVSALNTGARNLEPPGGVEENANSNCPIDHVEIPIESEAGPKKRGRKKKRIDPEDQTYTIKDMNKQMLEDKKDLGQQDDTEKKKKKRGRKPKLVVEAEKREMALAKMRAEEDTKRRQENAEWIKSVTPLGSRIAML